jgi:hypothetical protein
MSLCFELPDPSALADFRLRSSTAIAKYKIVM